MVVKDEESVMIFVSASDGDVRERRGAGGKDDDKDGRQSDENKENQVKKHTLVDYKINAITKDVKGRNINRSKSR